MIGTAKQVLGPLDESERLWNEAQRSLPRASESIAGLSEALELGIRAAEILVTHKLHGFRDRFTATIASLLEEPMARIDVERDAIQVPKALQFIDAVDMLSADNLSCISPQLHHGWEDRVMSCYRSRERARDIIGVTMDEEMRSKLMVLMAYRNRLFRVPPPVEIVTADVIEAYPALIELMDVLRKEVDA